MDMAAIMTMAAKTGVPRIYTWSQKEFFLFTLGAATIRFLHIRSRRDELFLINFSLLRYWH